MVIKQYFQRKKQERELREAMKPTKEEIEMAKVRGQREALEEFRAEQKEKRVSKYPLRKSILKRPLKRSQRHSRIKSRKSLREGSKLFTTLLVGPPRRIKAQRRVPAPAPKRKAYLSRQVPQMPSQIQALVEQDPTIQRMKMHMAMDDHRRMMSSPMLKNAIQQRRLQLQDQMRKRYSLFQAHRQMDTSKSMDVLSVEGNILQAPNVFKDKGGHILRRSGRPTILDSPNIFARR